MNSFLEGRGRLLRKALFGNALFSTLAGLTILFAREWVSRILGVSNRIAFVILGVGLIIFAATLVVNIRKPEVRTSDAWVAVWMDVVWVIASYVLIFVLPFSTKGKWVVGGIAEVVLLFAVLQVLGIRRLATSDQLG